MKTNNHIPVLLKEAIELLDINKNGIYVDCTAGRGGHSQAILDKLSNSGVLICIDTDEQAISYLKEKFNNYKNVHVVKANFSQITQVLKNLNINQIDGILADLGVSSPMFDDQTRGFSYHNDNKLDMRMDQSQKIDAEYVINNYSQNDLIRIFKQYGEINNPIGVVKNIIKARDENKIVSTGQLVDIIKASLSWKDKSKDKHPAKVYFQALRIEVNKELDNLQELLNQIPTVLKPNGRAVIISFHSLEDRIVKNYFNDLTTVSVPKEIPIIPKPKFSLLNNKVITASESELLNNKRAHSAKMRGIKKNV